MTESSGPGPRRPGVLVVEDEAILRDLLEQALPPHGFTVWAAAGAADAVEALARHPEQIDAALVDLRLPGLDGPDTVAALRGVRPGLPCCLMGGDADPEDPRLLATGCPCLRKPFHLAEVVRQLRALIDRPPEGGVA